MLLFIWNLALIIPTEKNNHILYIHKQWNHPPSIIKQIPSMISKQVSDTSCDKDHFNEATPDYSTALKENCLFECWVYNAVVNTTTTKNCFGTWEKSFKEKYNNHTSSFKNKSHQKVQSLLTTYGNWRKWQELHNRLIKCYESTSVDLWNEKMWFMFVWKINDC